MKNAYIALAAIGSTLAITAPTTPAFAAPASETMIVQYSDLDLTSARDKKILERRIDEAAKKICGIDQTLTGTRLKSSGGMRCYRAAKAQASKQFAALINEQRLGG